MLLVLIAVGTLLGWGYFIGIPRWKVYREREDFLAAVKKIKVGTPMSTALTIALTECSYKISYDSRDYSFGYALQEDLYGIHFIGNGITINRVQLFHLGSRPADNELRDKFYRFAILSNQRESSLSGYKLIYSDPPQN